MKRILERAHMALLAGGAVLAASLAATPTVAAEQTINAFAAYVGHGKVYLTGENKGTFVGAINGQLFVESEKGPLHAGRIVCPAMMQIDLKTGKQAGTGQCTITAEDGARVFAAWSCRGVHMVGCEGKMMLIDGTGRMSGVSGSGPMTVRTTSRNLMKAVSSPDAVIELGEGVLILRDFKLIKPAK